MLKLRIEKQEFPMKRGQKEKYPRKRKKLAKDKHYVFKKCSRNSNYLREDETQYRWKETMGMKKFVFIFVGKKACKLKMP